MELLLSILSAALLAGAAWAYRRGRAVLFLTLGAAFMLAAGAATVALGWRSSPSGTIVMLAIGLGLPLLALALYIYDRNWAPLRLHMSHAVRLCWVLWTALVAFDLLVATVDPIFRGLFGG